MISCQTHDYIEIACLYNFPVRITLKDKTTVEGQATTTETTPDKREWLVIQQQDGPCRIELQHICSMQALKTNPHFDLVRF